MLVYRTTKVAIDLVVATLALIVVAVPLLLLCLLLRLEHPGTPALFRQRRVGRGAQPFTLFKLRTMVPDAESRKEALRDRSTVGWPDFCVHDDPRVTRLGRVLRRTSLDELPQLLNVLRGDMSLVGPRPTSFGADTYALWQTERLEHRPGITGPWQLLGRGGMDFDARCRMEIAFFRRPSLLRELSLLARTPLVVLRRTGVA